MDETTVKAAAMDAGITALDTAQRNLKSELSDLESELKSSLGQWDGEARAAYQVAQDKWNAACDHMAQVVEKMRSVLNTITEGYGQTEREIQGTFGA